MLRPFIQPSHSNRLRFEPLICDNKFFIYGSTNLCSWCIYQIETKIIPTNHETLFQTLIMHSIHSIPPVQFQKGEREVHGRCVGVKDTSHFCLQLSDTPFLPSLIYIFFHYPFPPVKSFLSFLTPLCFCFFLHLGIFGVFGL